MQFDSPILFKKERGTMTYQLYPYDSKALCVIFVYGTDFQRGEHFAFVPSYTKILGITLSTFICMAAIVLFIIRKRFKLRRDGFLITFIDTMVAFVAGGNLRMQHRIERLFFGCVLISAFFIVSIFTGTVLDCIYSIAKQEVTFEKMHGLKSPIFISPSLNANVENILQMLK